jgi:hypothetical protein
MNSFQNELMIRRSHLLACACTGLRVPETFGETSPTPRADPDGVRECATFQQSAYQRGYQ